MLRSLVVSLSRMGSSSPTSALSDLAAHLPPPLIGHPSSLISRITSPAPSSALDLHVLYTVPISMAGQDPAVVVKGGLLSVRTNTIPCCAPVPLAAYLTWLICLSLEGRAYGVLSWRSLSLPSTQAGCLQTSSAQAVSRDTVYWVSASSCV